MAWVDEAVGAHECQVVRDSLTAAEASAATCAAPIDDLRNPA
jgi:hypothetical protein